VTVAQLMCDAGNILVRVSQHPTGEFEACLLQHLGIAGARFRELVLQAAFARIAQRCREVESQYPLTLPIDVAGQRVRGEFLFMQQSESEKVRCNVIPMNSYRSTNW